MKVVAITSNAEEHSLTNGISAAFLDGARTSGAETDMMWLEGEHFNPAYNADDRAHYLGTAPMPEDVAAFQHRIEDADVIALVFPIYWYSLPATMKGFIDRVICRGFAYDSASGKALKLAGKTVRIFALSGGSEQWYQDSGINTALQLQLCENTFRKYCGVEDSEIVYIDNLHMGDDSTSARAKGQQHLDHAREIGSRLATAHR